MTASVENARDRWAENVKKHKTPMRDEWCRRMISSSPIFTASMLLQGPQREPFNGRFIYGRVHLEWDRILTTQRRFAIMAPRGIGKSKVFSFAYPLWQMVRNKHPQGLLIGSTGDNAQRMLQEIRDEVETNPLLHWLYPTNRATRQWNTRQVTTSGGHTVLARSVLSKIRGLHPSYILGDDILSDTAKYSEMYRRKTSDFWFSVVENMPVPNGQLGLCGTPMHQSDLLYYELRDNPGYSHYAFPILDKEQRSLWPELFPNTYIAKQKAVLGNQRFTCEMMVEPVSDDTSLFPRYLLACEPQEQFTFRIGMTPEELAPLNLAFYIGVDLAFSGSAQADYFCLMLIGVDSLGNRWICDIVRKRGVSYHRQYSIIVEYGHKYRARMIYIEANAAQRIVGDHLIRSTSLPIRKFVTTAKKHDLESGVPGLRLMAENQKWRFPRGCPHSIEVINGLYDEMGAFTFLKGRVVSVGAHDDQVMALHFANQAAKSGDGFLFGSGPVKMAGKDAKLPGIAGEQVAAEGPSVAQSARPKPSGVPVPQLVVQDTSETV